MQRGNLCLFEPVQVVCLQSRKAHVVAAGAPIAGRAGGARYTYFVWSFSNPVTPGRQKHDGVNGPGNAQRTNISISFLTKRTCTNMLKVVKIL